MMDMVKVTKEMIPETETVELKIGDSVVTVKKHIPYEEKESMALEMSLYQNVDDEQAKIMYDNYKGIAVYYALICKHYTNIDTQSIFENEEFGMLFDWLSYHDAVDALDDIIAKDMLFVDAISDTMLTSIRDIYNRKNSLSFKVLSSVGSMFTEQDLFEALAKSQTVNNEIVSMMRAKEKEDHTAASKNKIKLGNGAVVHIDKKKTN